MRFNGSERMEPESIAHLAGLSGCLTMLDRDGVPPAQRMVFQYMQGEIMAIVRIEGIEDTFKTMLSLTAQIYQKVAPEVDRATEGKSKEEIEAMVMDAVKKVEE